VKFVVSDTREEREFEYLLPHQPSEIDRLDVQHYALLATLGRNFLAPVEDPARILDVGAGTGQWGFEVCRQFPRALVVGIDLEPGKPKRPANYRIVRANVLRPLPFRSGKFDFVHQRFMAISAIPRTAWPLVLAELVRMTAPGGWIELAEAVNEVVPAGPATGRLFELVRRVSRTIGIDSDSVLVRAQGDHLRRVGLTDVEQRDVEVPVGEWGGRAGSLLASNLRALHLRLAGAYEQREGVTRSELHGLLQGMQEECERHHSLATIVFAFGRRPPD
jgi:SAM-dependent methyltransferase